ncbi:hypothetical protein PR202_ga12412 [Eleusine coracana subsp. coracana]|uniref:Uncharacterized protein n=1 Tax=Eleusine coracana subsp. coracana TaxID=191504 RepID=A0AAV5CC53_ELECO|nr:hypothetical protein PR202_ga12412 [Eleusine coracana subsp. coracana]
MNFLYRTAAAPPPPPEPPRVPEQDDDFEKPIRTLEGLIAEDPHMPSSARPSSARPSEDGTGYSGGPGDLVRDSVSSDAKHPVLPGTHTDVAEDEGWITIPHKALPENWNDVSEMAQLQPLDRSFLFPGKCILPVHILACLSASKQDVRVISPFRIAALISKNGNSLQHSTNKSRPISANDHDNGTAGENGCQDVENDQQTGKLNGDMSPPKHDILETQTLLQMEDHKQQIELILQRFRESNFFVRIAESDEPLWSKKRVSTSNIADGQNYSDSQEHNRASRNTAYNTVSDKGIFDGSTSGGVARDTVKCYPLQNGDIVVVLQVNVGVNKLQDPVLEILQFEKCMSSNYMPQNLVDGLSGSHDDPCRELLSWLLPLDRTLPPRSLSPPTLNPSVSHKQSYSSGSQIFNFRSYSMPSQSSVQQTNNIRPPPISESQEFVPEKPAKTPDTINDGQLSFRGVPLEPERYSVRCGLEGVYLPGKRWRKKVEIIQPIEVYSFSAKCTVENLLCVIVKNIAPAHAKDIVVFIDAITIVFEEASKGGAPLSLPIASIEVLTLEATNMTSENLTLTVLAPEASGSSSVVSLNSSPTTPNSQNDGLNESARRSGLGKHVGFRGLNSVIAGSPKEGDSGGNRTATASGCTHLWLQSAVPLGCVPSRSSTTVKLELLPLTDGIITLDTLQITAREKGLTYIPEHSLEIHATSGISSGRA